MKKIEKLDMIYGSKISSKLPDRINDMVILSEKVNEIIDYLNIQPQTEEKECCPLFKEYKQDTPEQKEEWEERFAEFFLYVTNDKNWVDGRPEWKGDVFVTLYNAILHFIEKLLDEKEREAYEKGKEYQAKLDREIYGMSFEEFDKKWKPVSKLRQ